HTRPGPGTVGPNAPLDLELLCWRGNIKKGRRPGIRAASSWLDALNMEPEPGCELCLTDLAGSECHHRPDRLNRLRVQFPAIGPQKQANRHEGHPLIAIYERMVLSQAEGI